MAIIRGTYVTRLSGAVGDVVYRMRNGQNIASQKASQVKNPRTDAQQNQRMNMATVSAAYSALKVICDHSFEGKSYGSECMGEFMKRNLAVMKPRTSNFNIKGNPYIVPNPYLVSRGQLPSTDISSVEFDSTPLAEINFTDGTTDLTNLTVNYLHQMLGAQIGDQITILFVYPVLNGERTIFEGIRPQVQFGVGYARITAKTDLQNYDIAAFTTATKLADWVDTVKSENYQNVVVNYTDGVPIKLGLRVSNYDDSQEILAGTIILSRKQGETWLRSTQALIVGGTDTEIWLRDAVLASYAPTGNKYLNNASL